MKLNAAHILVALFLLLCGHRVARAEKPGIQLEFSLASGGLKSSLLDVYRARERFPASGEISGIKDVNPVTIYEPSFQYLFLWKGWRARASLSGEIYESPPNDRSKRAVVWNPETGLFAAQTETLSNMAAYQGEAAVGYEFQGPASWKFAPFLGLRYRQEDFAYESFSLPVGPGVLAFRSYDRRWTSLHMWICFTYDVGPFSIEMEPGWSLWAPGYMRGQGTSFDYDPSTGMTALYEKYHVKTLSDIRSMEVTFLFPVTVQGLDRETGNGLETTAFFSFKAEGIHFISGNPQMFYFGDAGAGNRGLIRDISVLNADRHDFRALISLGIRFSTAN